jgi:hypothetical protein
MSSPITARTVGLDLAEPLASADMTACLERGRRTVTFHLGGAGTLYRNPYRQAWIRVAENKPWSGEVDWVTTERRPPGDSYLNESFTERAREALRDVLVPAINRYGFDRLWTDLFSVVSRYRDSGIADELDRRAAWWRQRDALAQMVEDGATTYVPVKQEPYGREKTVAVVDAHRRSWAAVIAEVRLQGDLVGWLTKDGEIVPPDDLLHDRPLPAKQDVGAVDDGGQNDDDLAAWLAGKEVS